MQQILTRNSKLVFVWHDNSGQTAPENSSLLHSKTNTQGYTIDVANNAIINEPIILHSSAATNSNVANVINIGKHAQVDIIEYVMSDDKNANNNTSTTIHCGAGAQVKHCILQQASQNAGIKQQSVTTINQATNSKVATNIYAFGGSLNKIELGVALQGENADCTASYLAFTHDSEIHNVLLKIDHFIPRCTSFSTIRGVLKDKSTTDFIGRITVHPDARKTMAELQIKNLLCSPKATANNHPELEIYNDDVRCTHGSSTGQIDEDALFYMRSRGIDLPTAIAMLIASFIQPVIVSCTIPMIADFVNHIVAERQTDIQYA